MVVGLVNFCVAVFMSLVLGILSVFSLKFKAVICILLLKAVMGVCGGQIKYCSAAVMRLLSEKHSHTSYIYVHLQ